MSSVIVLVMVSCELKFQQDADGGRHAAALVQLHTLDSQHSDAEVPADGGVSLTILDSDLALELADEWAAYCQGERQQPDVTFNVRALALDSVAQLLAEDAAASE